MTMELPTLGEIEAFAMIVDINGFTKMVSNARGRAIAQFVRDTLVGGIEITERNSGYAVGLMGDAFLSIFTDPEDVIGTCYSIARDVDRRSEYISDSQQEDPEVFPSPPGGVTIKITIEYGWMDISTVTTRLLGTQRLFIGPPINTASRLGATGKGNRCIVGPEAIKRLPIDSGYVTRLAPVSGKDGEPEYECYEVDLEEIWRSGLINPGEETFWG